MTQAVKGSDQRTGAWWWIRNIVSWVLLLGVLAILLSTVVVPRLTESTPFTVLTGSMQPTYPPGTLIVVKPQDAAQLRAGDAITYQIESGKPDVVTHRIIMARLNSAGDLTFVTQGDANPIADQNPVVPEQIRGKVWYSVPYIGYVYNAITGQMRSVMLTVVVGALSIYAVFMFVGSVRDRTRRRSASADPQPSEPSAPAPRVEQQERHSHV
ncbi:signal peptidase I [Rhodococcus sp. IEGM 1409]|uniref:signal peptidase I n=1 Tax=Rhodococcus sp. IEGM 1409 TaxID=3047082 RepID=UPI0024B7D771|nr:signal peptidase I [Rhodococcus sp. IEGM 1409]MDI9899151.1 signal peptidase I [Rhodococcus sp. IEGM 1409]